MKVGKQCKIVKATYDQLVGVIFEYVIINKGMAPKWFQDFVEHQFKPLVNKVDGLVNKVDKIDTRLGNVEKRLDNVIKKNKLKE